MSNLQRAGSWSHWEWRKALSDGDGALPYKGLAEYSTQASSQLPDLGSRGRGHSPAWLPALAETAQAIRREGVLELIVAVACGYREVSFSWSTSTFPTPQPRGL